MGKELNFRSPKGTKVRFLSKNGMTQEIQVARDLGMNTLEFYTLERIQIGGNSSNIFLAEFPNRSFNSVMFENVFSVNPDDETDEWLEDMKSRHQHFFEVNSATGGKI